MCKYGLKIKIKLNYQYGEAMFKETRKEDVVVKKDDCQKGKECKYGFKRFNC
jgi:hypothetical protein